MIGQYSFGEALANCIYLAYTKLRYPRARLVRLPVYIRGAKHLKYGTGLTMGYGCRFDLDGKGMTLAIGKNCKMNDRVHIVAHESVTIGDDVLMASNIFISDTSHGDYGDNPSDPMQAPDNRPLETHAVNIGNRVWIGEGVCVLPGVELEDGCIVGANSVVTKSFPSNTVLAGVPARAIKRWNRISGTWERV